MKRFTVLGLCFVAAFAFSVLVAASAQAKTEHGELSVVFSGGESHLVTVKGTITSTSNKGVGHLTSPTAGTAVSEFFGVEEAATKVKCNSAGEPEGVVKTFLLAWEAGWIAKPLEAGVDFKPASGMYWAEFQCSGLAVKVKGSVIGHVTPLNVATNEWKLNLPKNKAGTTNSPESFEGGPTDILESEYNAFAGKEFESLLEQLNVSMVNHGNSSVCKVDSDNDAPEKCKPVPSSEFYTINGKPEFGRCDKQGGGKYADNNCTILATKKGKYAFVPLPG